MLGMIIVLAAVLFVVLPVVFAAFAILPAVLSGAVVLVLAVIRAGGGIPAGIVLGYALYRTVRKSRIEAKTE